MARKKDEFTKKGRRSLSKDQKADTMDIKQKTRSLSNTSIVKYREVNYTKCILKATPFENKIRLEVGGIVIHSRGKSKNITYFECSSHRLMNVPDCSFRGRIKDFDETLPKGIMQIIQEHL